MSDSPKRSAGMPTTANMGGASAPPSYTEALHHQVIDPGMYQHPQVPQYQQMQAAYMAAAASIPQGMPQYYQMPPGYLQQQQLHSQLAQEQSYQNAQAAAAYAYPKPQPAPDYCYPNPQAAQMLAAGYGYAPTPGSTVIVKDGFDSGARFDGTSRPHIPPPPPGIKPNAAQMAVLNQQNVVTNQKKENFLTGGKGAGATFW